MVETYMGLTIKNATSLITFGVAFIVMFGLFMCIITGSTTPIFSTADIPAIVVISLLGLGISGLIGVILGWLTGGSALNVSWSIFLLGQVASWSVWILTKFNNLLSPYGIPAILTIVFIGPPLAGIIWGMFAAFLHSWEGG
jgi:hypothetical protein